MAKNEYTKSLLKEVERQKKELKRYIYKICFKKFGRIYKSILDETFDIDISSPEKEKEFLSSEEYLKAGDIVLVKTKDGLELGFIVTKNLKIPGLPLPPNIFKIIKKGSQKEINDFYKIKYKEKKALKIARERVKEHGLPMTIVDIKYVYDLDKTIFYFCAPGRVDFRELVRDLARRIRTKIELWQIGVKDAAKKISGYGICGMQTCCSRYITQFSPITINMARIQDITIAPTNVSGPCGRLLCCLKYEVDFYAEKRKELPLIGEIVEYEGEEWEVVERNIILGTIKIKKEISLNDEEKISQIITKKVQAKDVKRINPLPDPVFEEQKIEMPEELKDIEDTSIDTVDPDR